MQSMRAFGKKVDYYSSISKGYNELYGEEQIEKAKNILKYIKPKGLLLDIGAGTGISTNLFNESTNILLEPSCNMLTQAAGLRVVGFAEKLPFKNKIFDAIISITSLHHSDIKKSLKEVKRVSKRDSQIAFTILKKSKYSKLNINGFTKIDIGKDILFIKK